MRYLRAPSKYTRCIFPDIVDRIYSRFWFDSYCDFSQSLEKYKFIKTMNQQVNLTKDEHIPFELFIIEETFPIKWESEPNEITIKFAGIKIRDIFKIFHAKNRYIPVLDGKEKQIFNQILKTLDIDTPSRVLGVENYFFDKSIYHMSNITDFANMVLIFVDYQECFSEKGFPETHNGIFDNIGIEDIKTIIDFYRFKERKQIKDTKVVFAEPKSILEIGEIYHKNCQFFNKIKNYVNKRGIVFNPEKEYVYETTNGFADDLDHWMHEKEKTSRDFVVNAKFKEWDTEKDSDIFKLVYNSTFIKYELEFYGNRHFDREHYFGDKFKSSRKKQVKNMLQMEMDDCFDSWWCSYYY